MINVEKAAVLPHICGLKTLPAISHQLNAVVVFMSPLRGSFVLGNLSTELTLGANLFRHFVAGCQHPGLTKIDLRSPLAICEIRVIRGSFFPRFQITKQLSKRDSIPPCLPLRLGDFA